MYVVVNICPGADMSLLMETLAARALTFSVTDDLSKLCAKCSKDSSNPLPVPHQVPDLATSPSTSRDAAPNSSAQTPAKVRQSAEKKSRPPLSAIYRTESTPKKQGIKDEEISEPDPSGIEEMSVKSALQAPMALNQLAQVANLAAQNRNMSQEIFKTPKEEPTTSMDSSMSPVNAAVMVSDLFKKIEEIVDGSPAPVEDVGNIKTTKDMFRGECRLCQMPISIRTHHMRRHAMKHLGFKTYICKLCSKDFNRSDLCKSHFERYHPGITPIAFQDIITSEQQDKLDQMIQVCFPDEHRHRQSQ